MSALRRIWLPLLVLGLLATAPDTGSISYATAADPETLVVDARDAYRGLMYSHMVVPVRTGAFTLVYPKWIPGEHEPDGPLTSIAELRVHSPDGSPIAWERDQVDMYAVHVNVPPGIAHIDVDFTMILNPMPGDGYSDESDVMSSSKVAVLNWNRALLYQAGTASAADFFKASVILPRNWEYGTALPLFGRTGRRVDFSEVPLDTLVDSPLDMGRYARHIVLWRGEGTQHVLDAFADHPKDLEIAPALLQAYRNVTPEAFALYGSRHWSVYHSLLVLSDAITTEGIEHHQSSDNRAAAGFLIDPQRQLASGDLLPHEFSHSWNGKYRRPFDLWQPDFQTAEHTELLWIYEGLNQYLGDVLSFRAGIRRPAQYPEYVASLYAAMDNEPGRTTTSIIDLATGASFYYMSDGPWPTLRRTADDMYNEGELVWLDVDTTIRELSHGRKSLDDFLHAYTEPSLTGPMVETYTREDIEQLLNTVQPYDWHGFFEREVYSATAHPPSAELARSGWRLVYSHEPSAFAEASDATNDADDETYGIGFDVGSDGVVSSVRRGSAAWDAGLGPSVRIQAVDGRRFTIEALHRAIARAMNTDHPIVLSVAQDGWVARIAVPYHAGLRYPHLKRIPGVPDMLAEIVSPHRGGAGGRAGE